MAEARSLGGLLAFAVAPVLLIAVLSWPVSASAFGLGVGTAAMLNR